jgi:hypothetical protein
MTAVAQGGGEPAAEASKADLVHRRLKEEIEVGELAPGTPLSELWLVERTGASRTPVREALRRLAAEGLVDLVPRQGARVSRVSLRSVRDLFDFRSLLEPAAMRQATEAAAADPTLHRAFAALRTEFLRIQRRPRNARARSTTSPTGSTGRSSAPRATSTCGAPSQNCDRTPHASGTCPTATRSGSRCPSWSTCGCATHCSPETPTTRRPRSPTTSGRACGRSSATWLRAPEPTSTSWADRGGAPATVDRPHHRHRVGRRDLHGAASGLERAGDAHPPGRGPPDSR